MSAKAKVKAKPKKLAVKRATVTKRVFPNFIQKFRPITAVFLFALIGSIAYLLLHAQSSIINSNGLQATATVMQDPVNGTTIFPVGRGRMSERNGVQVMLYRGAYSWQFWGMFRNTATGEQRMLQLPVGSLSSDQYYSMYWQQDDHGNLWVGAGAGSIQVWQFTLNGGNFPTSLTLAKTTTFAESNADSRANDLILLKSGGLVMSWHQQVSTSPVVGTYVAYLAPGATSWQVSSLYNSITSSSKWTTAQHPSDDSIWLFGIADAYSQVQVLHLSESLGTLKLDWYDNGYITLAKYGNYAPEAENSDIQAVVNSAKQTIDILYVGRQYMQFGDPATDGKKGAHPTIAHITSAGSPTFEQLDVWAERVSHLSLCVTADATWVVYHPVDPATLSTRAAYANRLAGGIWSGAIKLSTGDENYAYDSMPFLPNSATVMINTSVGTTLQTTLFDLKLASSDTVPPTTSISSPVNGATISGTVSVNANASDAGGIGRVDFLVDGVLRATTSSSPYTWGWSTTADTNGSHSLRVNVYDTSGNVSSASINVNINNTSTSNLQAPSNLVATKVTSNSADLSWGASVGAARYRIKQVTTKKTITVSDTTAAAFSVTGLSKNTSYSYIVVAVDANGVESPASNTIKIRTLR